MCPHGSGIHCGMSVFLSQGPSPSTQSPALPGGLLGPRDCILGGAPHGAGSVCAGILVRQGRGDVLLL